MATTKSEKPIHTLILDAGPIIKGEPAVSSMLQQCEQIISTPAVISEIRDLTTRTRLQTTLLPFLILRRPMPESVEFVAAFARRTGDYSVLSRADVELLALAYDLECERNNGDWRLRKTPGQKRTNAPPPAGVNQELLGESSQVQLLDGQEGLAKSHAQSDEANQPEHHREVRYESEERQIPSESHADESREGLQKRPYYSPTQSPTKIKATLDIQNWPAEPLSIENRVLAQDFITNQLRKAHLSHEGPVSEDSLANQPGETHLSTQEDQDDESLEDSDAEGWITPSNIKKKQLEDSYIAGTTAMVPKVMQAATITTDFAMQNVLLQMNLNLLSPSLQRVKHIKSFILRCHACFNVVRDLSKQFCPRCGGATLTRVTCTTDQNGEFILHLKKNMQWNKRGDKYSIPKPVHSAANYRVKGGGKGGWGNELILAEDQKEYVRAITQEKRLKHRDLMDEDYLPSILSGDRSKSGGKPKVGAGRTVNSRKR